MMLDAYYLVVMVSFLVPISVCSLKDVVSEQSIHINLVGIALRAVKFS